MLRGNSLRWSLLIALALAPATALAQAGSTPDSAATPAKPAKRPVGKAPAKAEPAKADPAQADPAQADPAKTELDPAFGATSGAPAAAAPAAAAPAGAVPAVKTGPKVLVLPYQPIYRSVDQTKAQTATDLLVKELSQKEGLQAMRGAIAQEGAQGPTLEEVQKLQKASLEAEALKDVDQAILLRKQTVEAMEKNAAALTDAGDLVLAYHYWARALMWAAKDKEALAVLDTAARMEPVLQLEPADFSRLYRAWFKVAAERVMKEEKGELMVKSALPGAKISLDGRPMDTAPVLLTKAVPGKHLLGASVDGVPAFATMVEVLPKKKNEFTVNFGGVIGGDAVGDVAEAITVNAFPKKAVDGAVKAGKAAGTEFVVAGGISKDDNHFNVYTFVIDVKSGLVRNLELVNFDLDLLTAESDVIRVVQQIAASVAAFSEGKPQLASIDPKVREQNVVNEVSAAPSLIAQASKEPKTKDKARTIFKARKGGTVDIKDED